jgi:succinate dehydrogenase/fumarate reductase cytochrome b subunit
MKYCSKCGNANADESVFCSSCGTPMEQAPAAPAAPQSVPAPEPASYSAPAPQQSAYTAPSYDNYSAPTAAVTETKNSATLWLILNIVATVLCCAGLFGILGIVFAAMGMGSFNKGDYEEMQKKSKLSMIMFIIGMVLGVISLIVIGILAATGAFASMMNYGY